MHTFFRIQHIFVKLIFTHKFPLRSTRPSYQLIDQRLYCIGVILAIIIYLRTHSYAAIRVHTQVYSAEPSMWRNETINYSSLCFI